MSKSLPIEDELERLMTALAEGELDAAGMRRLEQVLSRDAAARQAYYRYMSVHASLGWRFGAAQGGVAADAGILLEIIEDQAKLAQECEARDAAWMTQLQQEQSRQRSRMYMGGAERGDANRVVVIPRLLVYLGVAACLLVAGLVGIVVLSNQPATPPHTAQVVQQPADPAPATQTLPPVVAHIHSTIDAQWDGGTTAPAHLRRGTHFTLDRGYAHLVFDDGAAVIVQGPATFEPTGTNGMRMISGRIAASIPETATGFTVAAPGGLITNYGTEFGVIVNHDGQTLAQAFTGRIGLTPVGGQEVDLASGDALIAAPSGRTRSARADTLGFVRIEEYAARRDASSSPAARWLAYSYELRRDPSLLAYYSFDTDTLHEGSASNLADLTEGRFDATLGDGRAQTIPAPGRDRFGQDAGALTFDRRQMQALYVDDWPEVGELNALTISCWFKMSHDVGPWALLVTQWHDEHDRGDRFAYHLGLRDARTMPGPPGRTMGLQAHTSLDGITSAGRGWDIKDEPSRGGETTSRDGWVHVVLTVECGGGAIRLYKNGVEIDIDGARYAPDHLPWTRHPLVIGGKATGRGADLAGRLDDDGTGFFHGEIDDVAVFSRALTAQEARAMYDAGAAGAPPPR